jgi:hypothetical protein
VRSQVSKVGPMYRWGVDGRQTQSVDALLGCGRLMRSEAEDGPAMAAGWLGWQCATTKRNVPKQCLFSLFTLPLPPTGGFQKSDKKVRKKRQECERRPPVVVRC